MRFSPAFWVIVAAALFGASTPAAKALLTGMGPLRLAGLLYLGAALTVLPSALRARASAKCFAAKNILRLAGVAVLGGIAAPILLLIALERAPAASVALWLNLETVATALLGALLFREQLGRRGWIAVAVITLASVALASPARFETSVAAALVLAACVCWGLDNNLTAIIDGFTPSQSTFVKGVAAGVTNLLVGTFLETRPLELTYAVASLVLGAFSYGLSIVLYVRGAQQLGPTRSQMIFSTAPLFGAALAWLVLGEAITWVHAGAAVLMGAVLVWLHRERHEHEHHHIASTHMHAHRHDDGHHDHEHPGMPRSLWHVHEHTHEETTHSHPHQPDLHHRHTH